MSAWRLVGGRVVDPISGAIDLRDVGVHDGRIVDASLLSDPTTVDVAGKFVVPGFVDLHAALVHPERDGAAAIAGGFTTVVASPDHPTVLDRPDAVAALLPRWARAPCRVLPLGALTLDLRGEDLAEVGLLAEAGCVAVGQGPFAIASARVLQHALEYTARLGLVVHLRGGEPDLEGGVVRAGPRAVRLGLPGIPASSEEIGIYRAASLARQTGARIHLTHIWTAAGVRALRHVRSQGVPITASTTAMHLAVDPDATGLSPYDGRLRFTPPLGDSADRNALAEGLLDGTIDAVASDHQPRSSQEKDLPIQGAASGAVSLDAAFALVLGALGGDMVATVRALSSGPRRALGLPPARLGIGELADLTVVDPAGRTVIEPPLGSHVNSPLVGAHLPGEVVSTWVDGVPADEVGPYGDTG